MKIKTLLQENNERRKLLNDENFIYYENLLVYIRSSFMKDDRATEELLLELLEHLIAAQQDGKRAEEVFGKKPKELADDIIATLPNERPSKIIIFVLETILQFLGIYTVITGIPLMFSNKPNTIYIGSISLLVGWLIIGFLIIIVLLMKLLKSQAFNGKSINKKILWFWGTASGIFIFIVMLLSIWIEPFGTAVTISKYTQVIVGAVLLILSYVLKKWREAK
ncbi:DUF1129 family protein [Lysinibacillus sp. 54212]|uniref:DUF1129 family protein n=1 Tax=Lysinibacillus sp. 54212 TaxID=3119829 RepID=UPI002FC5DCDA